MLAIRLQRTGRKNLPTFRVVVAEHARPVKGKCIEIIGLYLPKREPSFFRAKTDRVAHWIKHGARPSDTVARLLKRSGYNDTDVEAFIKPYTKRKRKRNSEGGQAAPTEPDKPNEP